MRNAVFAIALVFVLVGTALSGTIFRGLGTRLNVPCLSPMAASGSFGTADSAQVISYRDDGSSTTAVRSFTSITNMVATTGWFDSTKDAGGTNWWLNVYVDSLAGSTPTGKMVAVKVKIFTAGSWSETNFNVYVSSGLNNAMAAFDGTGGVGLNLNQFKVVSTSDTAVVFATSASGKPAFARMNTNASGAVGSNGDYISSANREAAKYYASSSSSTAASAVLYQSASSSAPVFYIYNSNGGGGIYYYDGTYQGEFFPVGYISSGVINTSTISDNSIGASELADDAAREIASHILKDTTKRIGVKGGLGDSVLTPAPTVSLPAYVADTLNAILDTLQLYDNWVRDSIHNQSVVVNTEVTKVKDTVNGILDTLQLYDNWVRDSIHNQSVAVLATAASAANLTKVIDTVNGIMDSLQLYDNWLRDSIHNQGVVVNTEITKVKDTANAILDTLQLYDNWLRDSVHNQSVAVNIQVTKVIDTVNGIMDTLQNTSSSLRVDTNTVFTAANRDTILNRLLVIKDSTYAALDTLQNQDNWIATAANLTKVIDTVNAIEDTLQNGSSTLRSSGSSNWSDQQRDTVLAIFRSPTDTTALRRMAGVLNDSITGGGGSSNWSDAQRDSIIDRVLKTRDTVNAILDSLQNVNSALRVDTNTTWSTAQRDSVLNRTAKVQDSIIAVLDSLQNLASTLRLAGSDLDTVYQTVLCNDTIGGDFLLTLSDYRAQVKRKFGVEISNTTWMTDSVLNQLVREAIVTVNPIMRGYKTTKVMVSRFDSSDYPLDSLVGISSVLWHKDDTARSIPYLAREKWATLAVQNTYGGADSYLERPQVYDYTDALISFFPVPTSEDTIQINGWSKIPNITVVSSVAQIPQKYRIAILKYVTFLVARAKQHPLIQTYLDEYHESVAFLMMGQNVKTDSK